MDRRHLEDAAVSHAHLRGLLLIPVGALFLLAALANWDVVQTWALAAGVVVVGLLWLAIRHHYREHYGSVRTSPRQQARDTVALVLACAIVGGLSVLLRDLPVNAIAIGFAVAMGVGYALGPGLRTHHVVILAALLVAGALPVWDGADSANAGLLLAGIAVALTGIFDHRAFLHTFGPTVDAGA
jgi:hypothetical protein